MAEDLRKILKAGKAVLGTDRTLKALRKGELKQVFCASNVDTRVREDLEYYEKSLKISVSHLKMSNEELGVLCGKPFSVSVIGVLK